MRQLTTFEIHDNICDLYNLYAGSKIEFGRQANRRIGTVRSAKGGFVEIMCNGVRYVEIIQTTELLLRSPDTLTDSEEAELAGSEEPIDRALAGRSIDSYGLTATAYARIINQ